MRVPLWPSEAAAVLTFCRSDVAPIPACWRRVAAAEQYAELTLLMGRGESEGAAADERDVRLCVAARLRPLLGTEQRQESSMWKADPTTRMVRCAKESIPGRTYGRQVKQAPETRTSPIESYPSQTVVAHGTSAGGGERLGAVQSRVPARGFHRGCVPRGWQADRGWRAGWLQRHRLRIRCCAVARGARGSQKQRRASHCSPTSTRAGETAEGGARGEDCTASR